MEFMYKSMYGYDPLRHYENLKCAGYTFKEASQIVQNGMDRVWKMMRNKENGNCGNTAKETKASNEWKAYKENPFEFQSGIELRGEGSQPLSADT